MTEHITGAAFKMMTVNAAAAIEMHKQEINELNVFPVPDGDTGTNMSLTIGNGVSELRKSEPEMVGRAADIVAGGLLRGARGNSGVILSLLFRGMAKSLKDKKQADAVDIAAALGAGVEAAYKAVMKPAEGTILTVSRIAADAATATALVEHDVEAVLAAALAAGHDALANTVNQNPVLKKAGVVDAGGKGYLYILEGMLKALRGEMIQVSSATEDVQEKADFSDFNTEDIHFAYCTEFIVSRSNKKNPNQLRAFLDCRGDSIVVVDDDEIIKVHVHTNEPGVVLTEALTYGDLLTVKIENMREQHSAKVIDSQETAAPVVAEPEKKFGVVTVCAGDGMADIFRELGVDGIITGGQTMNPSTEDILREINKTPAEVVYVLPNNKNIIMAAQQCVDLTDKKVIIIPTKTVPQGISAMISMDVSAEEEENTREMNAILDSIHTVQITYAARDSEFDGCSIKAGEYLAMLEGGLIANDTDISRILEKTGEALAQFEPEILTIYYGADVTEEDAENVCGILTKCIPDVESSVLFGGQPVYYYMISAE
jgi:DAK2 domain fusion protein YloV